MQAYIDIIYGYQVRYSEAFYFEQKYTKYQNLSKASIGSVVLFQNTQTSSWFFGIKICHLNGYEEIDDYSIDLAGYNIPDTSIFHLVEPIPKIHVVSNFY